MESQARRYWTSLRDFYAQILGMPAKTYRRPRQGFGRMTQSNNAVKDKHWWVFAEVEKRRQPRLALTPSSPWLRLCISRSQSSQSSSFSKSTVAERLVSVRGVRTLPGWVPGAIGMISEIVGERVDRCGYAEKGETYNIGGVRLA